ncbi:MAG: FHA domain-containing protein [Deltaproteobacteria bacterium]|nr:FHA domain-containing protein [Deltaproteobacteria bacterium]
MLTLSELQHIAATLTGARFVKQVGPFVLLQHAAAALLQDGDERKRTALISKGAMIKKSAEIKTDLSKLEVTLLPPMAAGGSLKVGRAPDNDLILEDPSASKYHALLAWKNGHGELTDLGSMNGTTVNGQGVEANTPRQLRDGEVISFGGAQFVFYSSPRIFDILSSSSVVR